MEHQRNPLGPAADRSEVSLTRTERLMTKGFKAVAQRMVNAERTMIETLMNIANLTEAEARKAFVMLRKVKALKLDAVSGRYLVTHGTFMEPDVIRRAAACSESR